MSVLKSLPPLPRPSRADRTLLPAALTALLVSGVALLLALPAVEPLPEGGAVPPLRLAPLAVASAPVDPLIATRTLFSPARNDSAVTAQGSTAVAAPLGGARIAGVTIVRGRARVFVAAPDGKVRALVPGSVYLGWQLAGVGSDSVRFRRGGEALTLAIGSTAAPPAPGEASEEETK